LRHLALVCRCKGFATFTATDNNELKMLQRYGILLSLARSISSTGEYAGRDVAAQLVPVQTVLADAEFDSERNHEHIRHRHAARSVIPAKRSKRTWHIKGVRSEMRANFPKTYIASVLWWKVFSRQSSANSPRAHQVVPWIRKSCRLSCLVLLTTFIGSGRVLLMSFSLEHFILRFSTKPTYLKNSDEG
jgi:hypothetical protein